MPAFRIVPRPALAVFALLALVGAPARAQCPEPSPVVRDISAERFYTDPANSIPDPVIVARNKASLAPLDRALSAIVKLSDKALAGDSSSAACALEALAAQARGGAMLGVMDSRQAGYERKWRSAGIALAYLKVKPAANAQARAIVEPWLVALADAVEADYGRPREPNNHYYWAGLVAAAVGTATGETRHIAYARAAYESALSQIQPDGTLPRELARAGRALDYHNYALAPLILSAELAAARGEDWYGLGGGAIHRLVARTLAGIADPAAFARLAGVPSVEVPQGGVVGWLALYRRRFPGRAQGGPSGPFFYAWLGGDLALMAARGGPR